MIWEVIDSFFWSTILCSVFVWPRWKYDWLGRPKKKDITIKRNRRDWE